MLKSKKKSNFPLIYIILLCQRIKFIRHLLSRYVNFFIWHAKICHIFDPSVSASSLNTVDSFIECPKRFCQFKTQEAGTPSV